MNQVSSEVNKHIETSKLKLIGKIHYDETLNRVVEEGSSVLGADVVEARKAADEILKKSGIL